MVGDFNIAFSIIKKIEENFVKETKFEQHE